MEQKKKYPAGSSFWQIIFPTALAAAILIAIAVWLVLSASSGEVSRWGEISTVLLVIPVYIVALVFGLILLAVIYLVTRLMKGIPQITMRILELLEKIQSLTGRLSRSAARTVIEPASFLAGIRREKVDQDQEISIKE